MLILGGFHKCTETYILEGSGCNIKTLNVCSLCIYRSDKLSVADPGFVGRGA